MSPGRNPDAVIELTHIGKSYYIGRQQEVPVLTDINLTVMKGNLFPLWDHPGREIHADEYPRLS